MDSINRLLFAIDCGNKDHFMLDGYLFPTKQVKQLLRTFKKGQSHSYEIDHSRSGVYLKVSWVNGYMNFKGGIYNEN